MPFRRECIVFPTSRCIRAATDASEELILPQYMTMGEFLNRASLARGRVTPDGDLRLLGLHEASDFSSFAALNIERNFFSFIHNAQYIFRFFEELSSEQVEIDQLREVDVYGEYEEHISILSHLRNRYRSVCEKNNWSDPIFADETVSLNTEFLNNYDSVHIEVEGYLSRREIDIILACSRIIPLSIAYNATPYNRKMTLRLQELGFELEEGKSYTLSITERTIINVAGSTRNRNLQCEVFHSRIAQAGFVKAKIESFVESGISPDKIAVILPDETFAPLLMKFDNEGNFNFAMGSGFEHSPLYREIENVLLCLDESNVLNRARVQNINVEKINWVRDHYSRNFRYEDLVTFLQMFGKEDGWETELLTIVEEELQQFVHLSDALMTMDFKNVLRIFMNRLRSRSIDDTRGGKITVMGVLETRGIEFDGVIVVDFNEGYVPHKSEKDLFLNTKTRQFAGLPTSNDRESLQKHYYSMLFNRAKRVAIGCVQNSESVPSRFLLQLGIEMHEAQYRYERVLFQPMQMRDRRIEVLKGNYDFTAHPLSASSLKSFLTCRRQFYYRYIVHLQQHELPRDMSQERDIGNALHSALENLYAQRDGFSSAVEIKTHLRGLWENQPCDDPLERHMKRLWLEKLDPFYENEAERFASGWRVLHREKESSAEIEGIRLIGRIDRIDERNGQLEVIDYKSGKFPDTGKEPKEEDTDFQLSVYSFLAASFGEVAFCGYYDLGRGELMREQFLEAKNERLREILRIMASQTEWEWDMCEDLSRCRYCPYVYLCSREAIRGV